MTRTSILAAALVSTSLLTMACGGDDHDTAKFTGLDNAHLDRALAAMTGGDVGSLYVVGMFISGGSSTECPTITSSNNVTTVHGGCTTSDGDKLEGSIVATNLPGVFTTNPSYDPSKPGTVVADGWKATSATGEVQSIDGEVTIKNTGGVADNGGTVSGWADSLLDGLAAHTEISWTCDATDLCSIGGDAWFDIDGVGAATLSGTFRMDDPRTGAIDAKGAETLTLDVAASTDECRTYKINGGAPQQRCDEPDPNAKQAPAGNRWLRAIGR